MKQRMIDVGTTHRLARRNDTSTSKQGAQFIALKLGEQQEHAFNMVKEHPGRTANELDKLNGSTERQIGKRLRELERKGRIREGSKRTCEVTGRPAITWYAEVFNGTDRLPA